ncbi:MAG: FliI/YscN family ATPase [Rhodobacteraceae bacterium]|nr:FliI/YscN family ATPase [Paracoccaceae bacterium]
MAHATLDNVIAELEVRPRARRVGRIVSIQGSCLEVGGLSSSVGLGHLLSPTGSRDHVAEVISVDENSVLALAGFSTATVKLGDPILQLGAAELAPDESWIGRIIDPLGRPLDGRPLLRGKVGWPLMSRPPAVSGRRGLGHRLETGLRSLNTVLPLVRGQRIGLFAGPGVGKSTMIGRLAQDVAADVVVIAMCGERGREVTEFTRRVLGPAGLAKSVMVVATSDEPSMMRKLCGFSAMSVAEYFRSLGLHVLLLFDSVTRFADAHREVALSAGEAMGVGGYPASMVSLLPTLCERAGPGCEGEGDITAVFSVLVAGGDIENPVADTLRGVLDGHIVLSRKIAERGRFPSIDVLRSVSRALPHAASDDENALIANAREVLTIFEDLEPMVRAGLYEPGQDASADYALSVWSRLDAFIGESEPEDVASSYDALRTVLAGERPLGGGPASNLG